MLVVGNFMPDHYLFSFLKTFGDPEQSQEWLLKENLEMKTGCYQDLGTGK